MRSVKRNEDMSRNGKLVVIQQEYGDMIVAIHPDPDADFMARFSVEFCVVGSGGGRSPKTIKALRSLMIAMEEDNQDRPIGDIE